MLSLMQNNPQLFIILAFTLIFSLTFHEFGHAYAAYLCGDMTAKAQGRMSLNPIVHLDPIGSLMVLFAGIGYAKPVPVNPANFRTSNGDLYVSGAGPAMNFLLGLVGSLLAHLTISAGVFEFFGVPLVALFYYFVLINFNLGLFNLIPLGPLDGSYVFPYLLPPEKRHNYRIFNLRYGTQILMGLILLSVFMPGFSPLSIVFHISRVMMGITFPAY